MEKEKHREGGKNLDAREACWSFVADAWLGHSLPNVCDQIKKSDGAVAMDLEHGREQHTYDNEFARIYVNGAFELVNRVEVAAMHTTTTRAFRLPALNFRKYNVVTGVEFENFLPRRNGQPEDNGWYCTSKQPPRPTG